MKRMNDSFVFQELINGNNLRNKIQNINLSTDFVAPSRVGSIEVLNKKFNFPLKLQVMKYLNENKIKLIFNKNNPLPRYLNVIVTKDNVKGATALVDITNFATINEKMSYTEVNGDGRPVEILPKTLYTFMLNAAISIIFADRANELENNISLYRWCSLSYTKMVCKILDKMMGIGISDERSDIVHFLVAKFFLINVAGLKNDENTNKTALLSVINDTSYNMILENENILKEKHPNYDPYRNIHDFIVYLSGLATLERLNFRGFMEQWLRMYGESTMLAVDYLPAFISLAFGTEINAGLNRDYVIDNVAGRTNRRIITEFSKLM